MMMKTEYTNKKLAQIQPELIGASAPQVTLDDIAEWSQLRPSHAERPERGSRECEDSNSNPLVHASGNLPRDRKDFCKAWHWPGDPIDESESPEHVSEGIIGRSYTWARLATKARAICHPNNRRDLGEVEV